MPPKKRPAADAAAGGSNESNWMKPRIARDADAAGSVDHKPKPKTQRRRKDAKGAPQVPMSVGGVLESLRATAKLPGSPLDESDALGCGEASVEQVVTAASGLEAGIAAESDYLGCGKASVDVAAGAMNSLEQAHACVVTSASRLYAGIASPRNDTTPDANTEQRRTALRRVPSSPARPASSLRVDDGGMPLIESVVDVNTWDRHMADYFKVCSYNRCYTIELCACCLATHYMVRSLFLALKPLIAERRLLFACDLNAEEIDGSRLSSEHIDDSETMPIHNLARGRHAWSIEWDKTARAELLSHPGFDSNTCVFGDMIGFVVPAYKAVIEHLMDHPELAFDALVDVVRSAKLTGGSTLRSDCYAHKRVCVCCPTDGHCAGTPCTDFSSQGSQDGISGVTTMFLLVWMSLMNGLEPSVIFQENVETFPVDVMKRALGGKCVLEWHVDDSANFGWPGHRIREFTGFRHRRLLNNGFTPDHPVLPLSSFMRFPSPLCVFLS